MYALQPMNEQEHLVGEERCDSVDVSRSAQVP